MTRRWVRLSVALSVVLFTIAACTIVLGSIRYSLSPLQFLTHTLRLVGTDVLGVLYVSDEKWVENRTRAYWHGEPAMVANRQTAQTNPFVYESPDAPYLVSFRTHYQLERMIADSPSEYEAILKLAGWVGSQFDHGTDHVVGGDKACDPAGLIEDGRAGKKYWCEIAARLMVHAAASMALPARIVTASRDGYTWEHAVTEIWSNEFNKWFVVDTDFNLVFERSGIPLSAVELVEQGKQIQDAGELVVRRIAPSKPSLSSSETLYLYRYVHIDMRNDWCTRSLRRGSPSGGDRATWWVAAADFAAPMAATVHIEDSSRMNWQLNVVQTALQRKQSGSVGTRSLLLATFSPYFTGFEASWDEGPWRPVSAARVDVGPTTRGVRLRTVTQGGWKGPIRALTFDRT